MRYVIFLLIALTAGAVLPLQANFNVEMGKAAKEPVFAGFISFLIGTIGLLGYLFFIRYDTGSLKTVTSVNWYVWSAGILGAFYVVAVIILTPKLGTALTFGLVVTGQMLLSVILDHYGLFGTSTHTISWQRLVGVILLITGVVLIRKF